MKEQIKAPLNAQVSDRLFFLEFLKAISITAVVSYHAIFLPHSAFVASNGILEILFAPLRFCVPVFLTISFLLFERQIAQSSINSTLPLLQKRLIRLGIPTLFWFGIAALLKAINGNSFTEIINAMFTGEIFTGAYYLLIILQLMIIFYFIRSWLNQQKTNIFITIAIQGLVFLFIYATICGLFGNQVLTFLIKMERILIIYWFVYIALGIYLYKNLSWIEIKSRSLTKTNKILILCFTAAIMMIEYTILTLVLKNSLRPFDYAAFSCIFSVPAMFICFASINEKNLPSPVVKLTKLLSKYSLGIFCINGILAQIFLSIGTKLFSEANFNLTQIIIIKIIGWIILLTISLLLSIVLKRLGLKRVVN
ncbi:MAG: acyltransferase [Nostocales cyanobacterium 94392]|nr:acyltransferase [Nostocales cyanobacterium 94392]